MNYKIKLLATLCAGLGLSCQALADVQLASVFSDNMVLQRDKAVTIWGDADPGELIKVEFLGQKLTTSAASNGKWQVQLEPLPANSNPQQLHISASNKQTIDNILIGDVWLASGQSNMKWTTNQMLTSKDVIAQANNPLIRLLNIKQTIEKKAKTELVAHWEVSSASNIPKFSAIAAVFSQGLQQQLDVPIGIISAAVGSTGVEAWVSNETLRSEPFVPAVADWVALEKNWLEQEPIYLKNAIKKHDRYIKVSKAKGKAIPKSKQQAPTKMVAPSQSRLYPSGAYNGMIAPLFPFTMKGIVWRQGEANMTRGWQYQFLLPEMINLWRSNFNQADLPFIQVQLPELKQPSSLPTDSRIAELRESQFTVDKQLPNVHTVVLIDLQQNGNVHPKNKTIAGKRLVATALNKVYAVDKSYASPIFSHTKALGNKLAIHFSDISKGLVVAKRASATSVELVKINDAPTGFAIAGKDKTFHWAHAELVGDTVLLSHKDVTEPLYVRYGWADNPENLNVYDANGGPLMPFRSDTFTAVSKGELSYKIHLIK